MYMKWILVRFLKEVGVYIIVKFELEVLCVYVPEIIFFQTVRFY